ncbi:hypothetical protein ScPMuIL_017628 [Solemya velum]
MSQSLCFSRFCVLHPFQNPVLKFFARTKRLPSKWKDGANVQEHENHDEIENYKYTLGQVEAMEETLTQQDTDDVTNERFEVEKRRQLKMKIIKRKFFMQPQEVNLLTWAAKEQIRFLNLQNPDEWTIDRLTQSFPVSRDGVIKVLQSSYIPKNATEIKKHDNRVRKRWLALKTGRDEIGGPLHDPFQARLKTKDLKKMIHAGGNKSLPSSTDQAETSSQTKSPISGPFGSLVKNSVQNSSNQNSEMSKNDMLLLQSISKLDIHVHEDVDKENEKKGMHSETAGMTERPSRILSRREKRLVQQSQDGLSVNQRNINLLQMIQTKKVDACPGNEKPEENGGDNQPSAETRHYPDIRLSASHNTDRIKKSLAHYNSSGDDHEDVDGRPESRSYIYDDINGYQHPFGKIDKDISELRIPYHKQSRGHIYQKGNIVYDEDGEFLYKIP